MKITIELDPAAALCGRKLPELLSDTLFLLAGELSLEALQEARKNNSEMPL